MVKLDPAAQQRILIIRLSALGDAVYALPAVSALRRYCPRAFIAWAVEEAASGLLKGHPQIDELIVVPRKSWQRRLKRGRLGALGEVWKFRRELRSRQFDLAIDLQGNLRSALVAAASSAPCKIGFAPPCSREHSHVMLDHAVKIDPGLHKVRRNLALLEAIGVPAEGALAVFPPPSDDERRTVDDLLARSGVSGRRFVLMHPGVSSFGSYKQWPVGNYAELSRKLQQLGVAVLLSAGPGEEQLVDMIAAQAEGAITVTGLRLPELAELMRRAAAFVGSDTGPTQMAWMLGTPTVDMMGPKDPAIYGPLGPEHRKVTADVPCGPCRKRKCSDVRCMKEIAAEQVLEAAVSIIR